MTPEQYLLASAYLDGELTDDERRLAEADRAVMAEVEALRALQIQLADVEPPTAEARESAVAAAMAVFSSSARTDDAVAPLPAAVPSPVVRFRPRPAYGRYLGIAAAVVGIGLLGAVIVNSGRGSDDASSDAPDSASLERNMVENAPAVTDAAADEPADQRAESAADMVTAEAAAADAPTADAGAGDSSADIALTTDAPADAPAATTPADPSLPADDVLLIAAEDVIARRDAGTLGATPDTRCAVPDAPNAFILDEVELGTELGSVDLFLAIDDTTRMVYGIDPESCDVLVDAPLP